MAEMKNIAGGCHCGAVRFEAKADISNVMECNCSHCEKKGFLLAFTPEENFKLVSGADALAEYRFNKQAIAHKFCKVCGVQPFGLGKSPDGAATAAVNVRCVDGVEIGSLNRQPVDGRSF